MFDQGDSERQKRFVSSEISLRQELPLAPSPTIWQRKMMQNIQLKTCLLNMLWQVLRLPVAGDRKGRPYVREAGGDDRVVTKSSLRWILVENDS